MISIDTERDLLKDFRAALPGDVGDDLATALTMVRHLIHGNGGTVRYAKSVSAGAHFVITFRDAARRSGRGANSAHACAWARGAHPTRSETVPRICLSNSW
jgi:hypothetical protein